MNGRFKKLEIPWPGVVAFHKEIARRAEDSFFALPLGKTPSDRWSSITDLEPADFAGNWQFSFLYALAPDEYPWDGKGFGFAKDHVFYGGLKGKHVSLDRMQGALEAIDSGRLAMYMEAIPHEWRNKSGNAAERIHDYLELATSNSKMLFQRIREVLI